MIIIFFFKLILREKLAVGRSPMKEHPIFSLVVLKYTFWFTSSIAEMSLYDALIKTHYALKFLAKQSALCKSKN